MTPDQFLALGGPGRAQWWFTATAAERSDLRDLYRGTTSTDRTGALGSIDEPILVFAALEARELQRPISEAAGRAAVAAAWATWEAR